MAGVIQLLLGFLLVDRLLRAVVGNPPCQELAKQGLSVNQGQQQQWVALVLPVLPEATSGISYVINQISTR